MNTYITEIESFFKFFIDKGMIKLEFKKDNLIHLGGTMERHWVSIYIQELNSYKPSVDGFGYKLLGGTHVCHESINHCIQHIIMCITDKCINVIQDLNGITKEYNLVKKNII